MITDNNSKFVNYNQAAFNQLLTFIDFAPKRLTIAFVSVNFTPDRDTIIETLPKHPKCANSQLVSLGFADPDLEFFQDALLAQLAQVQREPQKQLVLLITGLEEPIKLSGDYPDVLQNLNFMRDSFTDKTPYPLVFFLPDYAITRFARFAPDFWAWKSGVFEFNTPTEAEPIHKTIDPQVLQQKSDELKRLLEDYVRIEKPTTMMTDRTYDRVVEIYREIGLENADSVFRAILQSPNTLLPRQVPILRWWATFKRGQGDGDESEKLYQQALDIEDKIKDYRNEARTLFQLANLHADRKDFHRARDLIDQAIKIEKQIGEANHQSKSFRDVLNSQQDAIKLEEQADEEYRKGDIPEAIRRYRQSLKLYKDLNLDSLGKARILLILAELLIGSNQELDTAGEYLNQAEEIYINQYQSHQHKIKYLSELLRQKNPSWFDRLLKRSP